MKDLGNILESVADALSDSMASRMRRNAVAKIARRLSDEAYYAGYNLIQSNCHLFVAACAAGVKPNDAAFAKLVGKGVTSIGRLESVLARKLNGGHPIEWCPVARNRERFRYKLTEEKVARLKMEGKL